MGTVDADQDVGLTVTAPNYIEQGANFDVTTFSGDTAVPTEESGITLISLRDIKVKTRFAGGFSIVSAGTVPGTGSYRATESATPGPIPGGVNINVTAGTDVEMHLPGPFPGGSFLTPPTLRITLHATGAPGTKISSKFAGTIPAGLAPPFADYGYSLIPRVNAPVVGATDAAASCAPNYGALANSNGEPLGTTPLLTNTTILPNTNPLVTITTPADGAKYLPEAVLNADFACTETVFPLASCVGSTPDGTQLDFSTPGQKTYTVTATDENGGVTTQTNTYEVGGNVVPVVDAGTDQNAYGGQLVTLLGGATDPTPVRSFRTSGRRSVARPSCSTPTTPTTRSCRTSGSSRAATGRSTSPSASASTTASTPVKTPWSCTSPRTTPRCSPAAPPRPSTTSRPTPRPVPPARRPTPRATRPSRTTGPRSTTTVWRSTAATR